MTQVWPPVEDDDWWDEGWDGSDCTDPACSCRDVDADAETYEE